MTNNIVKKHNYKLSIEDKEQIMIEYLLNRKKENVKDLCRRFDISEKTLYDIVKSKQGQEILEQHIIQSKKNLSKKLDIILDKTIKGLNDKLQEEDIKALDYAKILGITYDKSRLENNLSTSNNEVKISIKIEK
jgi:predicted DNA-binding transcriptional regulator